MKNSFSHGGIEQPGVYTLLGCKRRCITFNPNCLGFDVTLLFRCYLHVSKFYIKHVFKQVGVDHYVRKPSCKGNCPY